MPSFIGLMLAFIASLLALKYLPLTSIHFLGAFLFWLSAVISARRQPRLALAEEIESRILSEHALRDVLIKSTIIPLLLSLLALEVAMNSDIQIGYWFYIGLATVIVAPAIYCPIASALISMKRWTNVRKLVQAESEATIDMKSSQYRREIDRWQLGILGGTMLIIMLWGLLLITEIKQFYGAYPWQLEGWIETLLVREQRYTAALLSHKVKVPNL
ncbi:MAG TPA: hypothetical protein VGK34_08415 [Armatimonadota bacterium]